MPDDDLAGRLSLPESELPPLPVTVPGEATVTPLAPRLGAAAGMGSGVSPAPVGGGLGGGQGARLRSERPRLTPQHPPAPAPEPEVTRGQAPAASHQPPTAPGQHRHPQEPLTAN